MTAALTLERPPTMTPPTPPPARPEPMDEQLLAALPSAVGCAQRFARHTLEQWRLHGLVDTAEAVVAELVSDAVARTGIAVDHPGYLDLHGKHLNLVAVRLLVIGDRVLIEVWDADPTPPRPPDEEAPGAQRRRTQPGVRALAYDRAPTGGTVARVDLEVPPAGSLEDTQELVLPRRTGFPRRPVPPPPARPIEVMGDPVLLRRVLDGLHRLRTGDPSENPPATEPDSDPTQEDR